MVSALVGLPNGRGMIADGSANQTPNERSKIGGVNRVLSEGFEDLDEVNKKGSLICCKASERTSGVSLKVLHEVMIHGRGCKKLYDAGQGDLRARNISTVVIVQDCGCQTYLSKIAGNVVDYLHNEAMHDGVVSVSRRCPSIDNQSYARAASSRLCVAWHGRVGTGGG